MSNQCPHCGYENREQARFCAECGAVLPAVLLASAGALYTNGTAGQEPFAAALALPGSAEEDGAAPLEPENLDAAPAATAEHASQPAGASEPLEPGVLIAERFYVLGRAHDGDGQAVYQVEDWGVCRACGGEVGAAADEPYCTNCGGHLPSLALPWPQRRLREVAAAEEGAHVAWEGRTFTLVEADDADTTEAASAALPAGALAAADHPLAQSVSLLAGQRSDVGQTRAGGVNEDSLFALTLTAVANSLAHPTIGLYLVADGMGGHLDGEIASRTACETISADLLQSLILPTLQGASLDSDAVSELLVQAIQAANRQISALAGGSNMGTTAVLALVLGSQVYVANVGDSRAYLWGRQGLQQITADHSHVFLLKQKGVIEEDEIYTHPRRNEIYRSLGFTEAVTVDCFQAALAPGDLLLLCSDGLWEMLRNAGIADVLLMNWGDPQVICDELVSRANGAGGEDNISVIAVRAVGQLP